MTETTASREIRLEIVREKVRKEEKEMEESKLAPTYYRFYGRTGTSGGSETRAF